VESNRDLNYRESNRDTLKALEGKKREEKEGGKGKKKRREEGIGGVDYHVAFSTLTRR